MPNSVKPQMNNLGNYESTLSALLSTAGADLRRFDNVDWERAAIENPEQYKQAKAMYEQARATYDTIKRTSDEHTKRQDATATG